MNIDTQYFLYIVLSGFMFLWSYRKLSMKRNPLSDFEYLGFSSFWGILILAGYSWLLQEKPETLKEVTSNPFIAGVVLSIVGLILGSSLALAIGFIKGWLSNRV